VGSLTEIRAMSPAAAVVVKMSADLFVRPPDPTPVSGDGPELYNKRGLR